jgi:predicted RNA-binding Zn-ribbon protein involved in translation (DUF1610 family)
MSDGDGLDFECPGCGAEFAEGTASCPSCGLELDWEEEPDYECPDCGSTVPHEARDCPVCGAQFILGEADEEDISATKAQGGAIDEMLEAAVKETMVSPKRDEGPQPSTPPPYSDEPAPEAEAPDEGADALPAAQDWVEGTPPEAIAEAGEGAPDEAEAPAEAAQADAEAPAKEMGVEKREEMGAERVAEAPKGPVGAKRPKPAPETVAGSPRVAPKRYLGGFTLVGLVFVILAGVALVLTIIALRWDAISTGSKYEAIGSMQSLIILLGLAAFVFCAVASVYDLLRGAKRGSDKASAAVAPDLP